MSKKVIGSVSSTFEKKKLTICNSSVLTSESFSLLSTDFLLDETSLLDGYRIRFLGERLAHFGQVTVVVHLVLDVRRIVNQREFPVFVVQHLRKPTT